MRYIFIVFTDIIVNWSRFTKNLVIFIFFIFLKIKKQIKFDDNLKKNNFFFNILYNN